MTDQRPKTLSGKTAIVTGAGRGIGAGIAEALLEAGASVIAVDVDPDTVSATATRLSAIGSCIYKVCDVADRPAVDSVVNSAVEAFGSIDVLVNDAQAVRPDVPLAELTTEDFELTLNSGLWGTFNFMQSCYPHMVGRAAAVINFASSSGTHGQAGLGAYAATKEAIRGLSRVAAIEWGKDGITVNVICPAHLSPASKQWAQANPDLYQAILSRRAISRDGDPVEDIGSTVVFLSGDGARFITGETLMVNGGGTMRP